MLTPSYTHVTPIIMKINVIKYISIDEIFPLIWSKKVSKSENFSVTITKSRHFINANKFRYPTSTSLVYCGNCFMTGATPTSRSAMSINCKAMPINCSAMPINLRDANQLAQHQAIWCNHNQSTVVQRHQPTEAQINFMITSVQLQHPKAARNKTKQTQRRIEPDRPGNRA